MVARAAWYGGVRPELGVSVILVAIFMWGAFAAHAVLAPTQRDREVALWLGVGLELLRVAVVFVWFRRSTAMVWLPGLGFGTSAIVAESYYLTRVAGRERQRSWARLQLILLAPLSVIVLLASLAVLGHGRTPVGSVGSPTYDHALYAFDGTLSLPARSTPPAAVGQLFARIPLLNAVCGVVYLCEPLVLMTMMAGYVKQQLRDRDPAAPDPLIAYLIGGAVLAVAFSLCPAAGPAFAFGRAFPAHLPDPGGVGLAPSSVPNPFPRNCVPSGHVAFALLAYLTVSDVQTASRWLRTGALGFLIFTVLATLGLGEHYLIDLVLAVPLTVALRACSVDPRVPGFRTRLIVAATCLGILGIWIVLLRSSVPFFRSVPMASWCAILTTLALPMWLSRQSQSDLLIGRMPSPVHSARAADT